MIIKEAYLPEEIKKVEKFLNKFSLKLDPNLTPYQKSKLQMVLGS